MSQTRNMRPSFRACLALAVVLLWEVAVGCSAPRTRPAAPADGSSRPSPSVVDSTVEASGCRGVSVSVFFQPQASAADFPPVLSALLRSQGVLEIGFLSKQQALDEDLKEFGATGLTLTLADAPPAYQVIVQDVVYARRIKAEVAIFHGVNTVVVGPDINRPFVAASLTPVGVADTGLFYVGTVISMHCPS
jgi:hypothetical protein